jgi:hypothetical protein
MYQRVQNLRRLYSNIKYYQSRLGDQNTAPSRIYFLRLKMKTFSQLNYVFGIEINNARRIQIMKCNPYEMQ